MNKKEINKILDKRVKELQEAMKLCESKLGDKKYQRENRITDRDLDYDIDEFSNRLLEVETIRWLLLKEDGEPDSRKLLACKVL